MSDISVMDGYSWLQLVTVIFANCNHSNYHCFSMLTLRLQLNGYSFKIVLPNML